MTDEGSFWGQFSSDEGEGFRVDPDKVRKVDLRHERAVKAAKACASRSYPQIKDKLKGE